jgi:CO/xanthine dehydrogenase Mo-binding subunit
MSAHPKLPGSLNENRRLRQWLRFRDDGHVEVFSGKVEIGQGILTALAQIVSDELDIPLDRVSMVAASTGFSPNEAVTSGSLSIQHSGLALRHVCAEARAIFLAAAARRFGAPADQLRVAKGCILSPDGEAVSYWDFPNQNLLDVEATGTVAPKAAIDYRVVGAPVCRLDLPAKIYGAPRFIHDLDLPGMVHGRMLRPPSPAAKLHSLDEGPAQASPGVISIVRNGSLLGVLADTERSVQRALVKLRAGAVWTESGDVLPDERDLPSWLRSEVVEETVVASKTGTANLSSVTRTVTARFSKPFLAHASIAPSCALARFDGGNLEVWSHSQGIYNLRTDLALALRMAVDAITIQHVEGAGCYGHNPADDVAFDAAWLAREAGDRPVRVLWTRADELAWAAFAPAMAVDLEADLDADGDIVGWRHTIWSNGHATRPGRSTSPALLGAWHMEPPFERQSAVNAPLSAGGGAERNAVPSYDFPAWYVVNNRVLAMPLRTSAMRALGAFANVFAVESFMDELASASGSDRVAFRLRYSTDQRARAVIECAAEKSGWHGYVPPEAHALGIGYARYKNTGAYCAVVAEIEAATEIRVRRLTIAVDVGLVINPDGVVNQIEGGAVQATSWTLKEAVRFDRQRVTSDTWDEYPILRFTEVPAIDVHIVPSAQPSLGAGEGSAGPTGAAIANAVSAALGMRMTQLPLTAERIIASLG